jgi:hypothetical protein
MQQLLFDSTQLRSLPPMLFAGIIAADAAISQAALECRGSLENLPGDVP